jgi:hypothetical protein
MLGLLRLHSICPSTRSCREPMSRHHKGRLTLQLRGCLNQAPREHFIPNNLTSLLRLLPCGRGSPCVGSPGWLAGRGSTCCRGWGCRHARNNMSELAFHDGCSFSWNAAQSANTRTPTVAEYFVSHQGRGLVIRAHVRVMPEALLLLAYTGLFMSSASQHTTQKPFHQSLDNCPTLLCINPTCSLCDWFVRAALQVASRRRREDQLHACTLIWQSGSEHGTLAELRLVATSWFPLGSQAQRPCCT